MNSQIPVNGDYSYNHKVMDMFICSRPVEALSKLTNYMTPGERMAFNVAADTMRYLQADFEDLYKQKVEASRILNELNHSRLQMDVKGLLAKNPFNR
jgi:hypothetical protein